MSDRLDNWDEIAAYLRVHSRTAQRYAETRGLPIRRLPGDGPKPRVFAYRSELDKWLQAGSEPSHLAGQPFETQLVGKFESLSAAAKLYRRNFRVRFVLKRAGRGVSARIETDYEIVNKSKERQLYEQEVTMDDCERGYVETLQVAIDEKPIYLLRNPDPTEIHRGYVSFKGRPLEIEPQSIGRRYTGRAVWVIQRQETDFWYLHVGIPTFRVYVETVAPPDFDITPPFSAENLMTKSEHLDITWRPKLRPRDQ